MKKYSILIIGIILLIAAFVWMVLSQKSTGPFLILAGISGALISEGVQIIKKGDNP